MAKAMVKAAKNAMVEMSEEELNSVSGGGECDISGDSKFLNVLLRGHAAQPDRIGKWKAFWNGDAIFDSLRAAWDVAGICLTDNGFYCIREKTSIGNILYECTREQAMAHAQKVMGVSLSQSDWDW